MLRSAPHSNRNFTLWTAGSRRPASALERRGGCGVGHPTNRPARPRGRPASERRPVDAALCTRRVPLPRPLRAPPLPCASSSLASRAAAFGAAPPVCAGSRTLPPAPPDQVQGAVAARRLEFTHKPGLTSLRGESEIRLASGQVGLQRQSALLRPRFPVIRCRPRFQYYFATRERTLLVAPEPAG